MTTTCIELLKNDKMELKIKLQQVPMDYYSNVKVLLYYLGEELELFSDNLLHLKNIAICFLKCIGKMKINEKINYNKIGLLHNQYYHCIAEEIELNKDILMDENDEWIGMKYCCFESKKYATWLYKTKKGIFLKITPIYYNHFEEFSEKEYNFFLKNYKDIITYKITEREVVNMYEIIKKLYTKVMV